MTGRGLTLAGHWTGVYDYEDGSDTGDAVPFTASLFDVAGAVWGTAREPNTFAPGAGAALDSEINGTRSVSEVRFRKTYVGALPKSTLPVDYAGHVTADGNRVEGRWEIRLGDTVIGGPFVMNRTAGANAEADRDAEATAEASV